MRSTPGLRRDNAPQPLRSVAPEHCAELALRVDDESGADAPDGRLQQGAHNGKHRRGGLPRACVAEREGVTSEDRARDLASRRVQRGPLRDREPGRLRRNARRGLRRAHAVDEPQDAGDAGRDRQLAAAERAIEACEHRPIVGAQRSAHGALELSGESAQRSGTALRTRGQIGRQHTEQLAVRGLDVDRDHRSAVGVGHRPLDEPRDVLLVETGQIRENERRRRRGHGVTGGHAEEVVEERSAGLGDPLVTEREHQRRGARGALDDAGAHAHAARAPAPQRIEIVLERRRGTAVRGDDELDHRVEVDAHEHVDGVDKLDRRLVGQLAGELHDRAVGAVLIIDHGSLLP